jgi:hypothetical protein
MSATTAARPRRVAHGPVPARGRPVAALQALGAACLGVQGAVHLQQLVTIFHSVAWIGPLFALNAAGCALTIAALVPTRTRRLASAAGILISCGALIGLALSYTVGLFGWMEVGLRPPIEVAIASELGALVALSGALVLRPDLDIRPGGRIAANRARRSRAPVSTCHRGSESSSIREQLDTWRRPG